jgi:transposase-like protein
MNILVDDPTDAVVCPACARESLWQISLLGYFGSHLHYRCRYCGWTWAEALDEVVEILKRNGS